MSTYDIKSRYGDRKIEIETFADDVRIEITNTATPLPESQLAYVRYADLVEGLNQIPGFKVEYDGAIRRLPTLKNAVVRRGNITFIRRWSGVTVAGGGYPWRRVLDGSVYSSADIAAGDDFEVLYAGEES